MNRRTFLSLGASAAIGGVVGNVLAEDKCVVGGDVEYVPIEEEDYALTYNSKWASQGLSIEAFETAMHFQKLHKDVIKNNRAIAIFDVSLPSDQKRFFLIDCYTKQIIYSMHCSHGIGSADENEQLYAVKFPNVDEIKSTRLGSYLTKHEINFFEKHSSPFLSLYGLDKTNAISTRDGEVGIHWANYASISFLEKNGFLGRSHGCPTLHPCNETYYIIQMLVGAAFVFIYHPNLLEGSSA